MNGSKNGLGGLLDLFFDRANVVSFPYGQATMRLPLKEAGAEPDKSWCIETDKEFPDLVLEIALTSGGIPKLKVYQKFQIPEVWLWRNNQLQIYSFSTRGGYKQITKSRLLPGLDVSSLERCVAIRSWPLARRTFRADLASQE
jgi:Uma2 family endonuclease